MASVRSVDDALDITLTDNGRILRNIIHGADTVMSHILHFYHLSAVDFLDASVLGSPWSPTFGVGSDAALLPYNQTNLGTETILLNYVKALNIRRDAHTMSAIFSGRHPIQNAIVPGGVACMVTQTDVNSAKAILTEIRNFINTAYIVDVVTVATLTTPAVPASLAFSAYWGVGSAPNRLLSYGEYPYNNIPFRRETNYNNMLLSRGVVEGVVTTHVFDPGNITERVLYSYYDDTTDDLNPSQGQTVPVLSFVTSTTTQKYSWLKAPRYDILGTDRALEVGPLARVLTSYKMGNPTEVDDGAAAPIPTVGNNALNALTASAPYSITDLVNAALTDVGYLLGLGGPASSTVLYSPLGRHAARALECKFIADAMGGSDSVLGNAWLDALTFTTATDFSTDPLEVGSPNNVAFGYVYASIPKRTLSGIGLAEAPRGALGHWIGIEDKQISHYQCVVPSTWNCCPKGSSTADRGPAESAVYGLQACGGDPLSSPLYLNDAVLNLARMLHPYDFCIACAVHVVTPDGKELAKFKMDTDGKITRYPVDSE